MAAVTPTLTSDAHGREGQPGSDRAAYVAPPRGQTTLREDDDQGRHAEGLGEREVLELHPEAALAEGDAEREVEQQAGQPGPVGDPEGDRRHEDDHGADREGHGDRRCSPGSPHALSLSYRRPRPGAARRRRRRRAGTGVRRGADSRFAGSGRMGAVSAPSPAGPFAALPPQVDLPALEQDILQRWEADKVFARSMEATADRPQWVFYEGPPTANGRPGTHHIEARAFKDVFPRFKTMQGWHVPRRAGWDCHGLPVEIAVEQELGFAGKPDIERYGIAEFNARCRESVERHVDSFSELTRRMGYWVDMSTAYWTMDPAYIESVWWSLKQVFDKGLLVEDHRVAPYCPRCGTGLSDHEVAQGYETLTDPSVYVRLPVTSGEWAGKADLLDLDDDAVDAAVEHRRRDAPGRHLRGRAPRGAAQDTASSSPSRC